MKVKRPSMAYIGASDAIVAVRRPGEGE
ncbi:hypothetical protein XaFJ1_GM000188 [Xanthomonas albilineans]|nr:hypothetical protein XaFJ1_GM000188 [Xanthomonas albilineans]